MNNFGIIFGAICLLAAITLVLHSHKKTKKIMDTLDNMLTSAMNGNFHESTFDESRLSALETKFSHYFSSSALSTQNIAAEKDRIKALVGDIAHQTKTPLANLLLYAELLQEEPLSPEAAAYADTLHLQAEKLHFLIDTLLKMSRLENGMITLSPKKSPLSPMLEQVRQQFASKAAEKGLSLSLEQTSVSACFDAKWTSEALCNVVDNAIKYTEKGSITLSVVPYEMFIRIDVADTGTGIMEEEQAKIFSRFYRSEKNAKQDGVGIGLYLAREILKKEGGYIKITSEVGKGSVFSLFLPS